MTEHQPVSANEFIRFTYIKGRIPQNGLLAVNRHVIYSGEHQIGAKAMQVIETGEEGHMEVWQEVDDLCRAHEMAILKGEISIADLVKE